MNKLRELADDRRKKWDAYDASGQSDETLFSLYSASYIHLCTYMADNAEFIADLIDSANDLSWSLPSDHPLSVALDKLEEKK